MLKLILYALASAAATASLVFLASLDPGLPPDLRTKALGEQREWTRAQVDLNQRILAIEQAFAQHPELFGQRIEGEDLTWSDTLEGIREAMQGATRQHGRLETTLEHNHRDGQATCESALLRAWTLRHRATRITDFTETRIRQWIEARTSPQRLIERLAQARAGLAQGPAQGLDQAVALAAQSWPGRAVELEVRLEALTRQHAAISGAIDQLSSELASPEGASVRGDRVRNVEQVEQLAWNWRASAEHLRELLPQLERGWDHLLVDLDPGLGPNEKPRLRIRQVNVTPEVAGESKPIVTTSEAWVEVSRDDFKRHVDLLGMSLAHKPLGAFEYEVEVVPQPAGFAYMCSPAQRGNRYGLWQGAPTLYWRWLPSYVSLEMNFYGEAPYRSIDQDMHAEFNRHRAENRTYFGWDRRTGEQLFGTRGSATRYRFGSSHAIFSRIDAPLPTIRTR